MKNVRTCYHGDADLRPCPFCGAVGGERTADGFVNAWGLFVEEEILHDSFAAVVTGDPPVSFRIVCKGCGTRGPSAANEKYAVIFWNRRKAQSDINEVIA